MGEGFLVDFDYQVLARLRRCGAKPFTLRSKAAIDVSAAAAADTSVAYRFRDMGTDPKQWKSVLRYQGKLWWEGDPDVLPSLRTGEATLFGRPAKDVRPPDLSRRRIVHDSHDETLAVVQRSARDLLIVDDALYVSGGAPFFAGSSGLASTSPDRSVPSTFGSLRDGPWQCAWTVCHGRFRLPDFQPASSKNAKAYSKHWIIEVVDGDLVDPRLPEHGTEGVPVIATIATRPYIIVRRYLEHKSSEPTERDRIGKHLQALFARPVEPTRSFSPGVSVT